MNHWTHQLTIINLFNVSPTIPPMDDPTVIKLLGGEILKEKLRLPGLNQLS